MDLLRCCAHRICDGCQMRTVVRNTGAVSRMANVDQLLSGMRQVEPCV